MVVDDVASATSERLATAIEAAVKARGRAALCLSGGSTPIPVFKYLATRADLPWAKVSFAWGDERWVPHDHPDSNFRSARELLLDHVPVPPQQVFPFPYGDDPQAAAEAYAATLTSHFGVPQANSAIFDFNLLGMGPDGHTASLFPGTGAALRDDVAFALEVPGHGWRLTLSAKTLSASREVLFAVSSRSKHNALATTWPQEWGAAGRGPETPTDQDLRSPAALDHFPARAISATEKLIVITDVQP